MEQNMEENPNLAALIAQRAEFVNQMSARLGDACADAGGDPRQIASQLLDIILRSFEKQGLPAADAKIFDKSCVSRFGDELIPILRDILGHDVPISFLAHCIDGYWRGVRHVLQHAA